MSNVRIRNMFLLVTALAVMFLLACGGGEEIKSTPEGLMKEVVLTATPVPKVFSNEQAESLLLDVNDFSNGWLVKKQGMTVSGTHTEFLTVKKMRIKIKVHQSEENAKATFDNYRTEANAVIDKRSISGDKVEDLIDYSIFSWMTTGNPDYRTEKWAVIGVNRNITFNLFHEGSVGAADRGFAVSIAKKQMEIIRATEPTGTVGSVTSHPETSSQILYTSRPMNTGQVPSQIYKMKVDGSTRVNLTQSIKIKEYQLGFPSEFNPVWSPDRKKIAFSASGGTYYDDSPENINQTKCQQGIFVRDVDFSSNTETDLNLEDMISKCLSPGSNPTWSPDGTKLAFVYQNDIYIMNIDGTNMINITNTDTSESNPDWSPDGTKIAFNARPIGMEGYRWYSDIYVMDTDGSNVMRLTNFAPENYLSELELGALKKGRHLNPCCKDGSHQPSWSPDGTKIAFFLNRMIGDVRGLEELIDTDTRSGIHIMDSDGSNVTFLTEGYMMVNGIMQVRNPPDSYPTWSPDGTKVAFVLHDGSAGDIHTINIDGTNMINITNTDTSESYPDWSSEPEK